MLLLQSQRLPELIARATNNATVSIAKSQPCSGGSIHRAEIVTLTDGRSYFVKANRHALDMFVAEAEALELIAKAKVLLTPAVIATGLLEEDQACLVLETILPGKPKSDFWESFGARLAELHRVASSTKNGWKSNNFIGATIQKNDSRASWCEFFADCRLGHQVRLAQDNGLGTPELFRLVEKIIDRITNYLEEPQGAYSLLHGDLWSGNYLVASDGEPVLIDPAVYFGHREAELAMPLLFGGFSTEFFNGYEEAFRLREGWRDRVEIYKLYHLLNHLNLFGNGYLGDCLSIVRAYA